MITSIDIVISQNNIECDITGKKIKKGKKMKTVWTNKKFYVVHKRVSNFKIKRHIRKEMSI